MEEKFEEIEILIDREEYDRAIELCNEILEKDKNCALAYCLKAEALFYGPLETEKTIELTSKALELDPSLARAHYTRGIARSWSDNHNNYELELKDFDAAIEIAPDYAEAYLDRGRLRADLNDFEGAISDFSSAIELLPDYDEAYFERGEARYKSKDYYGAIFDYDAVLSINPRNKIAKVNRVGCLFRTGQIIKGILGIFGK